MNCTKLPESLKIAKKTTSHQNCKKYQRTTVTENDKKNQKPAQKCTKIKILLKFYFLCVLLNQNNATLLTLLRKNRFEI